jgi:hypothetical protein
MYLKQSTCGNIIWKRQKFSCLYPKYTNLVVCSIPTSSFFFDFFWRTCLSPPFFVLGPAWISYWMALAAWHKTQTLTNFRHPPRPRWSLFTTLAASAMPAMLCGLITGLTSRGATPQSQKEPSRDGEMKIVLLAVGLLGATASRRAKNQGTPSNQHIVGIVLKIGRWLWHSNSLQT